MRRRLMLMVLAVSMLVAGTIVGLLYTFVHGAVYASWQSRAEDTARVTAAAVAKLDAQDEDVTPSVLRQIVGDAAELEIVRSEGHTIRTGDVELDDAFVGHGEFDGVRATTALSREPADELVDEIVWILVGSSVIALGIGALGAWWYSGRLTEPLLEFARTAEVLATGDRRPLGSRYGIAELDAVAEVLDRAVTSFNEVLEGERRLTADASHQLRTPLTALSLRLEEIAQTDDLEVAHDEAELALDQVERLAGVSEQLVAATRGSHVIPVAPMSVDRLVTTQLAEWGPAFAEVGRSLTADGEAGLVAVAAFGSQSQVLATLLENSLRHGGGTTTLRRRPAGSWVAIEVRDEGPGVPPELAPRVFERDVTGSPGGTGLGLALARTMAAADGGRLELLVAAPAVFALFLPAADGAAGRVDSGEPVSAGG